MSWPEFYRRGDRGATARRSGVIFLCVEQKGRSATGLAAHIKCQREVKTTLAFYKFSWIREAEQDAVKLKKNAKRPACIQNTLVFAVGKGKPSYFTT